MPEQPDKHARSAEALRALAEGKDLQPLPDNKSQGVVDMPAEELAMIDEAPQARKARVDKLARRGRLVQSRHFKRMMIPLLVVVGIMLFVVGVICLKLGLNEASRQVENFKWLALAAFPLGAILLLGAWLFHRDVKRADN